MNSIRTTWSWVFLVASLVPIADARSDEPAAMRASVNVEGFEMSYLDLGRGEPLVLLHGFGDCARGWEPFFESLGAHYRLIVPDLRGHGASTHPSGRFSMRQSARDVIALLDALELPRVKAIGISAGGMTLLHIATQAPERIEAMALVGATTHFPEQARAILRTIPDGVPPPIREMFLACAARGEEQVDLLMRNFAGFADSHDDMNLTATDLGRIRTRSLIVHGDRDEFFPVDIPVAMYQSIPGSALWIIPQGDHVPIYGEQQGAFEATILRFLGGPQPRPQSRDPQPP
jgi:pimeloyl-ACP methyl ester carboxylesterase